MLENRKGPRARVIIGGGGPVHRGRPRQALQHVDADLRGALDKGAPPRIVATAAVTAVAVAYAPALYVAYQAATYTLPIVKAGVQEKLDTGSTDKAVEKMREEAIHQTGRVVRDATVSAVVGAAYNGATKEANIPVNAAVSNFVQAAIEEAISEAIGE